MYCKVLFSLKKNEEKNKKQIFQDVWYCCSRLNEIFYEI